MPHWINQPWQRNLSKTASDKPGAVQFEVFDQAAGGWKIILHPAPGSSVYPQTLITDQPNGLAELL
jgi:hypothetical protein